MTNLNEPVGAAEIRFRLIEKMGLSYADVVVACEHVAKQLRRTLVK